MSETIAPPGRRDAIAGCLIGTAVGDALGLPYEGLSPARGRRLLGPPDRHRFLLGWGMVSDDTEHAIMVAQSLASAPDDVDLFVRGLAHRLKMWILGLPAGVGFATLRSIVRLWFCVSPRSAGVRSAGNGPAMRAPVLGVSIGSTDRLAEFVRASTVITHSDARAYYGALAVAIAGRYAATQGEISPSGYRNLAEAMLPAEAASMRQVLARVVDSVGKAQGTREFAADLGLANGVSGFIEHSVPVALHAWLSAPEDFVSAVRCTIECGGDTDSTAAIVGGIVGARVTAAGIPKGLSARLIEWPFSVRYLEDLAGCVERSVQAGSPQASCASFPVFRRYPRNLLFLAVVLYHGFRRLFPPY